MVSMPSKSKAFEKRLLYTLNLFRKPVQLIKDFYHLSRNPKKNLKPALENLREYIKSDPLILTNWQKYNQKKARIVSKIKRNAMSSLERLIENKKITGQEAIDIKNSINSTYTDYILENLAAHIITAAWPAPPTGFIPRNIHTIGLRIYYETKKIKLKQKIRSGIPGLEEQLKDAEKKAKIHSAPVVAISSIFFLPVCWFGYLYPLSKESETNKTLAYLIYDQRVYSKKGITLDEYLQQVTKPKRYLIEKLIVSKKFRQKKHIEVAESIKQKGITFIVNPAANRGRTLKRLNKFREILDEYDFSYQIQIPQTKKETTALARELVENGLENIAVFSGDGTICDVINGIMQNNNNGIPDLALFNLGSGNGYATSLKIPRNFRRALEVGLNHNKKYIDLIKINIPELPEQTIYSQNLVGIGFDAEIQKHRDNIFRNHERRIAYFLAFLKSLGYEKTEMQVKMNGMTLSTSAYMLLIAKGNYYSPETRIAPHACLDDGCLDITIFHDKKSLINYFLRSSNLPCVSCKNGICHYKSKTLQVQAEKPIFWHHDGELMPACQEYNFEVVPKKIKIKTAH